MKTNKEIITEIIEDLDLVWPVSKAAKVTKEKLIECWSEYRKGPDSVFYNIASLSRAYTKIFKNIRKENIPEPWKAYILRKSSYKYCIGCKKLIKLSNFNINSNVSSNKTILCKICNNDKCSIYHENNKEEIHSRHKKYAIDKKELFSSKSAKYRAAKLQRTPKWLTDEDDWMFKEIYSLAKLREELTGAKWHVDHIIPLQGELVCGLHVPINLQVITATENLNKSNKYIS